MRTLTTRLRLGATALFATALLAGCGDDRTIAGPESPRAAPARSTAAATPTRVTTALRRHVALPVDITVRVTIGPRGGRIVVPFTGFALDVPAGAVAAPTSFRVTALRGIAVAYTFGPEGASFALPLVATQDLRFTAVDRLAAHATLGAAHFESAADVDTASGTAVVGEERSVTVLPGGAAIRWEVPHFSGWMVHI